MVTAINPNDINKQSQGLLGRYQLAADYIRVRKATTTICTPLEVDDFQVQSITESSPPKWHLAHTTWFFETFILQKFISGYNIFHTKFSYLFNSYYQTVGTMQPRAKRSVLSRPTIKEIYAYRDAIDEQMLNLLSGINSEDRTGLMALVSLGLHHEQQHQELLYMDIKHNFWCNPLHPAYLTNDRQPQIDHVELSWETRQERLVNIGDTNETGFAFDNERPQHKVWLDSHRLANRLVSNKEYLEFMEDKGYQRSELWLSDGWQIVQREGWHAPLYWEKCDGKWHNFTLYGLMPLDLNAPVAHISYYEAEAFAAWMGKRLPKEAELETKLSELPISGHFVDEGYFQPYATAGQFYGSLWEWTASPYIAYPRFKPLTGSIGEYNGKFMCNQYVLKGGACVTSSDHIRPSYRNFFYAHNRWQFAGIRLADDLC